MIDCLFIVPSNAKEIYQQLSIFNYTGVENPTWGILLAGSIQKRGFRPAILDTNAEQLTDEQTLERIRQLNPRLICILLYGANVNSGICSMSGATRLSKFLKTNNVNTPISYIGTYVQSLPLKSLNEESSIDFCFTNEGVRALWNILALQNIDVNNLDNIKGIAWRKNGKAMMNPPEEVVTDLDNDLDYAWELLPQKQKPLDLYRSPLWHSSYLEELRSPYAAIQTSLGCRFSCEFCHINMINRNDNAEIGIAGNYSKMRYFSPEVIVKQFDKLYEMGVHTIKITDELFMLDKRYYIPLCKMLKDRGYGKYFRLWIYSRCDSLGNPETLQLVKDAGVKWIALGIESANRNIRLEVSKGKFQDVDIKKVVQQIHDAGIEVMANFMVGMPSETLETMNETLNLALELCTSAINIYSTVNLPGSQLYANAIKRGYELPKDYTGYSFHSYDAICNRTEKLTAAQILKFRDDAYITYHTNPKFLERVKNKFGNQAVDNIESMTKIRLRRKIIEEAGLYKD